MFEASYIVGSVSAGLLILAVIAWIKLFRAPALQPVDGGSAPKLGRTKRASRLLVAAFALSAVAAALAVIGLFAG